MPRVRFSVIIAIMYEEHVVFDCGETGDSIHPFWRKLTTAGRAAEGLRAAWRDQLRMLQAEIGYEYIRFHGLLHDDMMVYQEDPSGNPSANWHYVDDLFDFLQSVGLKPFVELGFMPQKLASGDATTFWWRGNITPPKDYDRWAWLVRSLVVHCIERYGLNEVRTWYWEVWNEPNFLDSFWTAGQREYFMLYEASARAIKNVDARLKVGGPATTNFEKGEAPWIKDFLAHCAQKALPVDFITTHPYPNDWPVGADGKQKIVYRDPGATAKDLAWLRQTVASSSFPDAEIHLTEWNCSALLGDFLLDTAFMAPFVIKNNVESLGLVDSLGFWTFTDIFEEKQVPGAPFHGGFGLINLQGLTKPSYNGYWFLSKLGTCIIAQGERHIVTMSDDGAIQVLLWNYCHFGSRIASGDRSELSFHDRYGVFEPGEDILFQLRGARMDRAYRVLEYTCDREHGSVFDAWLGNGAPMHLLPSDIQALRNAMRPSLRTYEVRPNPSYTGNLRLRPHGASLIVFRPGWE